ncbi:MAG: VanZ family protein [bacterium]
MLTILSWFPLLLWSAFIFFLSSIPSLKVTENWLLQIILNDGGHFSFYGVLAVFAFFAFFRSHLSKPYKYSLLYAILFGISDELHQHFVPGRTMDIRDLALDTLGALTFLFLLKKLQSTRYSKGESRET